MSSGAILLAEPGEPADVGEQYRGLPLLAAQLQPAVIGEGEDLVGHLRGDVPAEQVFNKTLVRLLDELSPS